MPRWLRYLRIAFSAVCAIACVLLIALWMRSRSTLDELYLTTTERTSRVTSLHGELTFVTETPYFPGTYGLVETWGISSEHWETQVILPPMPEYSAFGFSLSTGGDSLAVGFPIWSAVLCSAICGAAPWLRWRCRFRLRTLLIGMTLAGVALGLVAYLNRQPTTPPLDVGDFDNRPN